LEWGTVVLPSSKVDTETLLIEIRDKAIKAKSGKSAIFVGYTQKIELL
jgi:hypothetical protein